MCNTTSSQFNTSSFASRLTKIIKKARITELKSKISQKEPQEDPSVSMIDQKTKIRLGCKASKKRVLNLRRIQNSRKNK